MNAAKADHSPIYMLLPTKLTNNSIVTLQHSRIYMNAAKADHSPHIYAIADQAYQ